MTATGDAPAALSWVRRGPYRILPVLGAGTLPQLQDNLGCLEFDLTPDQLERPNAVSPVDLGFPQAFLTSNHVHRLIFGETYHRVKQ